ncbi:MAG: hypothetical protein ACFFCI_16205 [Promethearchaeota archaeon]
MTEESIDYIVSYSEQRLQNLAHEQIWKGQGTETNPFVVKNANILGQAIMLNKTLLHISLINCNFDHAQFEGCQNILLKNCTFKKLVLNKCNNFRFDESFITDLSLSKSKHISFENTIVFNVSTNSRIKDIVFIDCQLNNDFLDYILRKNSRGLYSKTKEIVSSVIIILIFFIFHRLIFLLFILNPSEIINLLLFIVVTILLLTFLLLSFLYEYLIKKKHPNIKIMNY